MRRAIIATAALATIAPLTLLAPSQAAIPIPPLPTNVLSAKFIGHAAKAQPIKATHNPQNPHLGTNGYNSMHNDAYGTNAYKVRGPLGRDLQVRTASYGVSECATVAFDSRHQYVGLCGGLQGFTMRLIDPTTLTQLASLQTSKRDLTKLSNPFTDLCGGTYFYLDNHDRAYVLTTDKKILVIKVGAGSLKLLRTYSLAKAVTGDDCAIATMPDWSGRIFFATQHGTVGVVNPTSGKVKTVRFKGQGIFNSMSGDESGAIYVVTDHRLYSVAANSKDVPHVRWSAKYDRGSKQKPGQLSQGSGTTPTLIGRHLVAITDNADPRMHVQFYRRNGKHAGHRICQAAVFAKGKSDTENTLAAAGQSVIVENNYGYSGLQSTELGKSTTPGVARVRIHKGHCKVLWTNHIVAPTSVPKVSLGAGLAYVYAKPPSSNPLVDTWYFSAIDIRTGKTVWQQRTGNGIQWNNHYASIYLGPDHAAYIATIAGLIRFKDGG